MRSIENAPPRSSGYDVLRLVAATGVIFGHAFSLTKETPPGFLDSGIATISVKVFFIISGVLVTRSWLSDPTLLSFFVKRGLRIMPALIVLILITAFLVGPLVTSLPAGDYLFHSRTYYYLNNVLFYPVYSLPGLFAENRYPNAVNGSLWSLPCEVALYFLTAFAFGKNAAKGRILVVIGAVFFVFLGLYEVRVLRNTNLPIFYGTGLSSFSEVAPYYVLGAMYAALRLYREVPIIAPAVALIGFGMVVTDPLLSEIILLLFLPLFVIGFGETSFGHRFTSKFGDISYGLFLYGFLVQQVVEYLLPGALSAWQNFAISLAITAIIAKASWHLVEKPALKAKWWTSARFATATSTATAAAR